MQTTLVTDWTVGDICKGFVYGGYRSAITGARLKAEGVRVGIPDLFLAVPTRQAHGLWIEMKRQKGGEVRSSQKAVMAALDDQGFSCTVCKGWQEARRAISDYLGEPHDEA